MSQTCPHCGGEDFTKKGFVYNKTTVYQDYICKSSSCGKHFKGTTTVRKTEFNT